MEQDTQLRLVVLNILSKNGVIEQRTWYIIQSKIEFNPNLSFCCNFFFNLSQVVLNLYTIFGGEVKSIVLRDCFNLG